MLRPNFTPRQDQTVDHEFEFRVYPRREGGSEQVYQLTRKPWGWLLRSGDAYGSCDKRGAPYLFRSLEHDGIEYPESMPDRLRTLWLEAYEKDLTHEEVQQALDRLAAWLRNVDEHAPAYKVRVND
jgi:hypothetical protein